MAKKDKFVQICIDPNHPEIQGHLVALDAGGDVWMFSRASGKWHFVSAERED